MTILIAQATGSADIFTQFLPLILLFLGMWFLIIGPQRKLLGSFRTFFGGMPTTRMLDVSAQNGTVSNIPAGLNLTPSQLKVMVMS